MTSPGQLKLALIPLDACRARYEFSPVWPKAAPGIDWSPLLCTLPKDHAGQHEDERERIPWTEGSNK